MDNIRIMRLDATVVLEKFFQEKSIDHMYCLFPCPWPKKKHTKYRLFSNSSLRLINSRLKSNAELIIVTDFFPYSKWIEDNKVKHPLTKTSLFDRLRSLGYEEDQWREHNVGGIRGFSD